ncbi:hypothetical protein C4577_06925 [Candidatus Parcubacteria bacterium]|nr:MAG: hypothetical protein C4577_06925 [Candidatus Parcubacteria bacterium]
MEIIRINDESIRIKGKKISVVTDPDEKAEGDVFIYTTRSESRTSMANTEGKLVVEGPGEYEVGGVHFRVSSDNDNLIYKIDEDSNVLLLTSKSAKKVEEGDYTAVIIKAVEKLEEGDLSNFSSSNIVLYGKEENIALNDANLKRIPKVNLKKKDEIQGFIVVLSK